MKLVKKLLMLEDRRGFTLIELLVVMIILGLLAALVGPKLIGNVDKAKIKAAKAQIELLSQGLDQFRLDVGRFPSTAEGLQALVANPGVEDWEGPYLKKPTVPKDSWNKEYAYKSPGTHGDYDISSYGADGQEGGSKENQDINSWE
ncbi:MAG: type II secretion system major pseudopilin GspG [Candidatus Magnetoovum sp. WYHC-5]|nr:type II secretion system major pseudopilin GspG [Candidatus Magnetoovum sp. WYHC-5]